MSRKLRRVPVGNKSHRIPRLYGGFCRETFLEDSVQPVNELALRRLRHAISAEYEDEEEQLGGVLRMLGKEIPDKNQLALFGKKPAGKAPSADPH